MSIRDNARRGLIELAVVVVGVLIALSADRWMQTLDERATERTHLTWLLRDLRSDSVRMERGLAIETARQERARRLLEAASAPASEYGETDRAYLLAAFQQIGWSVPPVFSTATWSQMVAAGNLSLLRDPELRQSLSGYYAGHAEFRENEEDREYRFSQLEDVTLRVLPSREREERGDTGRVFGIGQSEADLGRVVSAIRSDSELRSLIGYAGGAAGGRLVGYSTKVGDIGRLMAALRAELDREPAP
jgi:hypothetical protein